MLSDYSILIFTHLCHYNKLHKAGEDAMKLVLIYSSDGYILYSFFEVQVLDSRFSSRFFSNIFITAIFLTVKNGSSSREDPLEEKMGTHSSILA